MTSTYTLQRGRLAVLTQCTLDPRLVMGLLVTAGKRTLGWALDIEAGFVVFYISLHLIWGRRN